MPHVSPLRQERIKRNTNLEDSFRSLVGELMVRFVIINKLEVFNIDLDFGYNPYGKPFLLGDFDFNFNISHSGEWVVCVIHSDKVGIDLEKVENIDLNMVNIFFNNEEKKDIKNKKPLEQLNYFYDLWTIKESYLKALGKGLNVPLNSFYVKKSAYNEIDLFHKDHKKIEFFKVQQLKISEYYKLSICYACNEMDSYKFKPVTLSFDSIKKKFKIG